MISIITTKDCSIIDNQKGRVKIRKEIMKEEKSH